MKSIIGMILMAVGICSCGMSVKENDTDHNIVFTDKSGVFIPEWVDSVYYLKLQTCEDAFLSHLSKVIFKNDRIYIGDFVHHKIVVYRSDGSFGFSIDKKGRGPDEYQEIKSFSVDDSVICLIDNYRRNLQVYDAKTGNYIATKSMPFIAWDLELLKKGVMAFAYSPLSGRKAVKNEPGGRLFFTDQEMKVLKTLFPFSASETDAVAKDAYFSSSRNQVVYNCCIGDHLYIIDQEQIDSIRKIVVDFGDKRVSAGGRRNLGGVNKKQKYLYATPVVNGGYIAFDIAGPDYSECYLYDCRRRKMASNPEENSWNMMSFPHGIDERGRFVYIIENKEYYDDLVADGFVKASPDFERHLEDGIGALFYVMKK